MQTAVCLTYAYNVCVKRGIDIIRKAGCER